LLWRVYEQPQLSVAGFIAHVRTRLRAERKISQTFIAPVVSRLSPLLAIALDPARVTLSVARIRAHTLAALSELLQFRSRVSLLFDARTRLDNIIDAIERYERK
jgi:hypothetical protein